MNAADLLRNGGPDPDLLRLLIHPVDPERVAVRTAPRWMTKLWVGEIAAMAVPGLIYVRGELLDLESDPSRLICHELVHVRQWKDQGVWRFLWRYVIDYAHGRISGHDHQTAYRSIGLEVEARTAVTTLFG